MRLLDDLLEELFYFLRVHPVDGPDEFQLHFGEGKCGHDATGWEVGYTNVRKTCGQVSGLKIRIFAGVLRAPHSTGQFCGEACRFLPVASTCLLLIPLLLSMPMSRLILLLCLLPLAPVLRGQDTTLYVASAALGAERRADVWLPAPGGRGPYPVLYLPEGPRYGGTAAALARELHQQGRALPLIVVGIHCEDAAAELAPALAYAPGQAPARVRGDRFAAFLTQELIPAVEQAFDAAPYRLLAGQGEAGLFTLAMMMQQPESFGAYIAAAPAVHRLADWERDYRLFLVGNRAFDGFVHIGLGFGDQPETAEALKFARLFGAHAVELPLTYQFAFMPDRPNAGLLPASLGQALEALFADTRLATMYPAGGIATWWEKKQALIRKYGYDPLGLRTPAQALTVPIYPLAQAPPAQIEAQLELLQQDRSGRYRCAPADLYSLAAAWAAEGHAAAAGTVLALARRWYPAEKRPLRLDLPTASPNTNAYGAARDLDRGLALHLSLDSVPAALVADRGPAFVPGLRGQALAFDGQDDRWDLRVAGLDGHEGSFSVSVWVKPAALRRFDRLMGQPRDESRLPVWQLGFGPLADAQWGVSTHNDGWKDFWINDAVPPGQWSHLVAVVDQALGEVRYYRDGAPVGVVRDLLPMPGSGAPLLLGCNASGGAFFQGEMDELRLYTRGLSPAEVEALWQRDQPQE